MQALPVIEMLEFAGNRTDFGVNTVPQDDESIVVEQMWDRVLVVGKVLLVGSLDVLVDIFELHEHERYAVHEAHDIGAAAIQIALNPKLTNN